MFWYTNVRKRKRKAVFLFILICFLSSSLFAQNLFQDIDDNEFEVDNFTFDSDILKNLKTSSYPQTFGSSGEDINITLHQSYMNTSFDTIVNTSIVNGNNFTLPSPKNVFFNSTFTNITVNNIIAPNKSLIIDLEKREYFGQNPNKLYHHFRPIPDSQNPNYHLQMF